MTKRASDVKYTGGTNEAGASRQSCAEHQALAGDRSVRIRAAIFFDGTLNNRTNTQLGHAGINKGASYANALTNIAILEQYFKRNEHYDYSFAIYIEGIGTEDDKNDNLKAAALGTGSTGILDKVEAGIIKIINNINTKFQSNLDIEYLHLDCFGFSRGAAAARNFVYSAVVQSEEPLKLRLQRSGHRIGEVKVKFVGLYDTVASSGLNHDNDTGELHLDAIRHAEHVVQLAAADEHRKNFPLTNINSAPKGKQLFLPGAHSDIGGGYVDPFDEVDLQILVFTNRYGLTPAQVPALAREKEWLLKSGWCHEHEIEDVTLWDEVKVTRKGIRNHYQRIPLKIMAKYAAEKGVNFLSRLEHEYAVPPDLKEVEALLSDSPVSSPEYWKELQTEMMKKLRHDYLHFSAYYGSPLGCNDPLFTDHNPVHGNRKRRIHNG